MAIRQTRIFVVASESQHWYVNLLGRVCLPIVTEFASHLSWFWFSPYVEPADNSEDCEDIDQVPLEYRQLHIPGRGPHHRTIKFRYHIDDDHQDAFEQRARSLISQHNYRNGGFLTYSWVSDLGGNRFVGTEIRELHRIEQRASLIAQFLRATCCLILDTLIGPDQDGQFRVESNDDGENPLRSSFESLHHLFCHVTEVPTAVTIFRVPGTNVTGLGTFWNLPTGPPQAWTAIQHHLIRY